MFENLRRPEQVESLSIEEIVGEVPRSEPTAAATPVPTPVATPITPVATGVVTPVATPVKSSATATTPEERQPYLDATHTGSEKSVYSVMYRETVSRGQKERHFGFKELSAKTGIRSDRTVRIALDGLIAKLSVEVVAYRHGDPLGPRYRVYDPKEIAQRRRAAGIEIDPQSKRIATPVVTPVPTPVTTGVPTGGKSYGGTPVETTPVSPATSTGLINREEKFLNPEKANDDDEAAAPLLRALKGELGRKVDGAALAELFAMLAAEFKIAEGRTGVVSNPAAFFLTHMRQRLWKTKQLPAEREGKSGARTAAPAAKVDASKCPDCFGTGMYYPGGFEKGVARCTHETLTKDKS